MEMTKYKLSEIGEVCMCKRILKEETNTVSGIPFYKIGTFGNKADVYISREKFEEYKSKYSYPKKGDVLISAAGTIGRTVVFDGSESYFQDSNIVWINNDETIVLNQYLFYCYKKIQWFTSTGSTILRLYNDNIRNTEIVVPSLENQRKIIKVLSALDDKIALNQQINRNLEEFARLIYDYWFVQFDFPDKNGKPYKTSGGKMVYNDQIKREIPEGWDVRRLGDLFKTNRGVSYSTPTLGENGDGVPMINLASFSPNESYNEKGIKYYKGDYTAEKILKPFDFVMCNTQQTAIDPSKDIIGRSMLVPDIFDGDIVSSHHVNTIKLEKENLKFYLNRLFNTKFYHSYISKFANGTNILGLIFSGVEDYLCEIPTDELLDKFANISLNIEKKKSRIIKENQELTALRDRLLPLLMNGQVVVG